MDVLAIGIIGVEPLALTFSISPFLSLHPLIQSAAFRPSAMMGKVSGVHALFNKEPHLLFQTPREINRMTDPMYNDIANFFSGLLEEPSH